MKKVSLQYGKEQIEFAVPDSADVLSAKQPRPLADAAAEIRRSLAEPVGCAPLAELSKGCQNAAVVVSDNTRPVPYKGPKGILQPILETLKQNGVEDIKIIVATGTHRPMTESELRRMLGGSAFQHGVEVINHVCTDESMLRLIGSTQRTPQVTVNSHYLDAELKIVTGLVEPHFMAGFSGGRKAICPGICGQSVTYGLHSAQILNEKKVASLVLQGNACHEESLRIAKMAGVDFTVNVTIDQEKRITGVFSGDLEEAHLAATESLGGFTSAKLNKLYDVVITQAGEVGVNHYQCAKAAFEATAALKGGGSIILSAHLTDPDAVGSNNYKDILVLLGRLGAQAFCEKLLSDDWSFVPDQWEGQMWAKVFVKLTEPKRLYICAPRLAHLAAEAIPETNVARQMKPADGEDELAYVKAMVQDSIDEALADNPSADVLIMPDGPYVVPVCCGG